MTPTQRPPDLNAASVLSKCDYFVDAQLWPPETVLNPRLWLENFSGEEKPFALRILDSFFFFSDLLCDELFHAAFQQLSRIRNPQSSTLATRAAWRAFVDRAIFTYVTGEQPNATDSGFLFARRARRVLAIPEEQIVSPGEALQLLQMQGPVPVIFVDDFVGSGNQFARTWTRRYPMSQSTDLSFRDYARIRGGQFYYCPLVCTERGADHIRSVAPDVVVSSAHLLPERYSAVAFDSVFWPKELVTEGIDFVRKASTRAGIPDTGGADVCDWQGFHCLGLTLAFAHSVPDATLPIFYWEENGWKPLIRKT